MYGCSKNNRKIKNKEPYALIQQKPNKKIFGLIPIYLNIYNLAPKIDKDHYFKKIGESPTIINHRLTKKSANQIELYYKNKAYLDANVSYQIEKKKTQSKCDLQLKYWFAICHK